MLRFDPKRPHLETLGTTKLTTRHGVEICLTRLLLPFFQAVMLDRGIDRKEIESELVTKTLTFRAGAIRPLFACWRAIILGGSN
jgi:hypothetical protein